MIEQCPEKHSQKFRRFAEVLASLVIQDHDTKVLSQCDVHSLALLVVGDLLAVSRY
jgi:hypothetical protein